MIGEQSPVPAEYTIDFKGGTTGKPGVKLVSKTAQKFPLASRRLENQLDRKYPNVTGPARIALTEHTAGLGVRYLYDKIKHPKIVEKLEPDHVSRVERKGFESGITKLTSKVALDKGSNKVTCFIDPADFVPFSFRTLDILPAKDNAIPVSASLLYLARHADIPAVHMTSAGWNRLVACADRIDLKHNNANTAETAIKDYIDRTTVSLDTRFDSPYFSVDDFFTQIHTQDEQAIAMRSPQYPPYEGQWLVTLKDGTFAVRSLTQLRELNTSAFKENIASICSLLAYVQDETFPNNEASQHIQKVNSLVFFGLNGKQRIGSIHSGFETNADNMFILARTMITQQYPEATNIAIGVIDGGGSSGAIVQKNADGRRKKMDISTIPHIPVRHEVPMYVGMVSADSVPSIPTTR